MNLPLVKVAVVAAIVVAFGIVVYLGIMLLTWRELRFMRSWCQRCTKELDQLEFAHKSIEQGIGLIKDNMAKCAEDETCFHEKKLMDMRKALEKNERKTKDAKQQLERYQLEVEDSAEMLHRLKTFAWLRDYRRS